MLYCPKCQQTYEEGAQRFCLKDGARLLPAPSSGKSANQTGGVFSKILNRNSQISENGENRPNSSYPSFSPPTGTMFKAEEDLLSLPEIDSAQKINNKPLPRFIKPNEVPLSQAPLGNRKTDPTGRPALSWENPEVLLGQTVKNRYLITKKLEQDEDSISYLAEDKLVPNKKVLVRILMEQDANDKFTNKIFAEERVSLSHINHPNVASVIDSGELLEGNPFIITEYVEGISVKDTLNRKGEFNAQRTARIVRQVANALSTVHQNGILHRNLKPENIILAINEEGSEQVKLINFGVPNEKINKENLAYKSPEQLEGNVATFASDVYSLAVVAYQMLTGRLPFNSSLSVGNLLKSQREGMALLPTNLRPDLPSSVDAIFEKALTFKPSERYPKARDFGDTLYNTLQTAVTSEKNDNQPEVSSTDKSVSAEDDVVAAPTTNEKVEENVRKAIYQTEQPLLSIPPTSTVIERSDSIVNSGEGEVLELEIPPLENAFEEEKLATESAAATTAVTTKSSAEELSSPVFPDTPKISAHSEFVETENAEMAPHFITEEKHFESAPLAVEEIPPVEMPPDVKTAKDLTWEKRSPEPPVVASSSKTWFSVLGIAILLAGMFAVWYYVLNRPNKNVIQSQPAPIAENTNVSIQNSQSVLASANLNAEVKPSPAPEDIEIPPPARSIPQPPNTVFFETSKENLKGDLLRNFVGFSLYYPKDWTRNETDNKFLDISKNSSNGLPIEQLLVSYYDSKGTFNMDKANFPKLVEKSNKDLAQIIPNFQTMSEGETKVNGDWRAYEVKFQGGGKVENGEKKLIIWGRRLWIPAARPGTKDGFVVTMLATSLSPEVTSVDDVGIKGDLASIFETFEPNQNF